MKKEGSWLTAAVFLIVGIVLICFHSRDTLLTWVVEAIGILIVVPSVWLILSNLLGNKERRSYVALFAGFVTLAIGLWVCMSPDTFAAIIVYVFAAVLILAGIWHMASLTVLGREVKIPGWLFIIPALMIVAGLAFLFTGLKLLISALVLVMGIALVCSALNTVLTMIGVLRMRRKATTSVEPATEQPTTTEP